MTTASCCDKCQTLSSRRSTAGFDLQVPMSLQQSQTPVLHVPGPWLVVTTVTTWVGCCWTAMSGGLRTHFSTTHAAVAALPMLRSDRTTRESVEPRVGECAGIEAMHAEDRHAISRVACYRKGWTTTTTPTPTLRHDHHQRWFCFVTQMSLSLLSLTISSLQLFVNPNQTILNRLES